MIDVETGGVPVADGGYDTAQERATTSHATATDRAAAHDVELDTLTEARRPARAIVHCAGEHDVDRIIVGSHGRRGSERALPGSGGNGNASCSNTGDECRMTWLDRRSLAGIRTGGLEDSRNQLDLTGISTLERKSAAVRSIDILRP